MVTENVIEKNFGLSEITGNKITIGFKVAPLQKLRLSQAAKALNLTLSEFCEMTILSKFDKEKLLDEEKTKLIEHIHFYENDKLHELFKQHQGETVSFVNTEGVEMDVKVENVKDVFTILINSFKYIKE